MRIRFLVAVAFLLVPCSLFGQIQFGSISGVLTRDGAPAANVRVGATLIPEDRPLPANLGFNNVAQTDASGRFKLENVRPGRFLVSAGIVDTPTFYPSVTGRAEATVVNVNPGEAVTGIDFRMVTPLGLQFSGRVVRKDEKGNVFPAAPAGASGPLFALIIGGSSSTPSINMSGVGAPGPGTGRIAPDGSFQFTNVRPGTYQLVVNPGGVRMPRLSVTLTDRDITDYELAVPLMVSVSGTATIEGGGPIPRIQLEFNDPPGRAPVPGIAPPPANAITRAQPNPAFQAQLPTGDQLVRVATIPPGFALKSMMSGNVDLTRNPLPVSPTVAPIQIVLSTATPSPWVRMSGRVVGKAEWHLLVNFNVNHQQMASLLEPVFFLDGTFEIPMTLPGELQFRVGPAGTLSVNTVASVGASGLQNSVLYVPSIFTPPVFTESEARSPGVKVAGRITGRAKASRGSRLRMRSAALGEIFNTPIYMDGSFEFARVPPGVYSAEVYPAIPGASPTTFTVGDVDLREVRVVVPDNREVAGRVLIDGRGSTPKALAFSFAGSTVPINLAADGSFRIDLPAGQKFGVVAESVPSGYSLVSATYGTLDVLANPIRLSDSSADELRVTLRANSSFSVSGRVVRAGQLPAESRVWLSQASGALQPLEARVNADGTFTFASVPPGSYLARLSAPGIPATAATASVQVSGGDVAGVEIAAPREVRGRVTASGNVLPMRFALPLSGNAGKDVTTVVIDVQSDGTFTAFLPIGERRVGAPLGLPAGSTIPSLTYGSADILRNPVRVTPSDSSELRIQIETSR